MTKKWFFDKKFIEDVINKGYTLLEDPKITKSKKKNIRTDIATFTRFLNNDYEDRNNIISKPPHNLERLKSYILKRMEAQYNHLEKDIIFWTMDLCAEEIFESDGIWPKTQLSLDDQVTLTLENYAENSPRLLSQAKPILSNDIIKQVQEVPELQSSSYCYHDEITDLPYLIINPKEAPWILNHETEHAIEDLRKIEPHRYYSELGPIFFEILFNDTLYKQQGYLNRGDYIERIEESQMQLLVLFHCFDVMLKFAGMGFQVPTDIFFKEISELCVDKTHTALINFLRNEIAPTDIVDDMSYLYSYLKAIELREETTSSKQDCAHILDPYIKSKKFNFTPKKESFDTYRRFTEEMQAKTKI